MSTYDLYATEKSFSNKYHKINGAFALKNIKARLLMNKTRKSLDKK